MHVAPPANPWYDAVIEFSGTRVPSKRVRLITDPLTGAMAESARHAARQFEKEFRARFGFDKGACWPTREPVVVAIEIVVPKEEFESGDVDNVSKTLLDGLKGIMYADDRQVTSLFIQKVRGRSHRVTLGIRRVRAQDDGWLVPALRKRPADDGAERRGRHRTSG